MPLGTECKYNGHPLLEQPVRSVWKRVQQQEAVHNGLSPRTLPSSSFQLQITNCSVLTCLDGISTGGSCEILGKNHSQCCRMLEICVCSYSSSCHHVLGPSWCLHRDHWQQVYCKVADPLNNNYTSFIVWLWNMGAEEGWRAAEWHFQFLLSSSFAPY